MGFELRRRPVARFQLGEELNRRFEPGKTGSSSTKGSTTYTASSIVFVCGRPAAISGGDVGSCLFGLEPVTRLVKWRSFVALRRRRRAAVARILKWHRDLLRARGITTVGYGEGLLVLTCWIWPSIRYATAADGADRQRRVSYPETIGVTARGSVCGTPLTVSPCQATLIDLTRRTFARQPELAFPRCAAAGSGRHSQRSSWPPLFAARTASRAACGSHPYSPAPQH